MADAVIVVEGTLVGSRTGEYQNKPFGVVQLQAREKDAIKMIEVNLADGFDINRYQTGTKVKIPVRVGASKDGKRIYYREIPATEGTNADRARSASEATRKQPASA
jgi:hypothetical protein